MSVQYTVAKTYYNSARVATESPSILNGEVKGSQIPFERTSSNEAEAIW